MTDVTDAAIERVEESDDQKTKAMILAQLRRLAQERTEFTADDLWKRMSESNIPNPREGRVIGAIMLRGAREKWIETTTDYRVCQRENCHKAPIRVWKSLIYAPIIETQAPSTSTSRVRSILSNDRTKNIRQLIGSFVTFLEKCDLKKRFSV